MSWLDSRHLVEAGGIDLDHELIAADVVARRLGAAAAARSGVWGGAGTERSSAADRELAGATTARILPASANRRIVSFARTHARHPAGAARFLRVRARALFLHTHTHAPLPLDCLPVEAVSLAQRSLSLSRQPSRGTALLQPPPRRERVCFFGTWSCWWCGSAASRVGSFRYTRARAAAAHTTPRALSQRAIVPPVIDGESCGIATR